MPNLDNQPSAPDPQIGHGVSTEGRLGLMLRAFANAPLDADTPQLLISQAVAATGSSGGVVCGERGDRLVVLASEGYTPAQRTACGSLMLGDLSLPLTYAATTGQPVWLVSQADTAARFPRVVELVLSPLLREPDGTVTTLGEARGAVLGFGAGDRPERMVTFGPGSFLVLFTDGLVERRGEVIDTGLARIGAALKTTTPAGPVDLCDALIEQSLPRTGRNDDAAILCAFLA